jgi:hypothetical protein
MGERAFIVKFGREEDISQLQQQGLLYLNNLQYFWKIEDGELRGDQFDSVDEVLRGGHGKVYFSNGANGPGDMITNWTIRIHPPESEKINIFCMHALRPSAGTFPVDEKNFRFGEYALVIKDVPQFIDRIGSYLKTH